MDPETQASTQTTMQQLDSPEPLTSSTPPQDTQTSGQTPPSSTSSAPVSTAQTAPAQPGSPVGLSPEQFQELLARVPQAPAQPQQPQRQYTMEDFNRTFNVMQIDDGMLQPFGFDEERLPVARKAFEGLRDGIVRQAMTMAEYYVQQRLQEVEKRYAPVERIATDYETERLKKEFFTAHPDLKGLDQLAIMVRDRFIQEGKTFPTKELALKAVAEGTRALAKQLSGGQQVAPAVGQQQQQQTTTGMSTVSAGGQGGVGSAQATGGKKPAWAEALS